MKKLHKVTLLSGLAMWASFFAISGVNWLLAPVAGIGMVGAGVFAGCLLTIHQARQKKV